MPNKKNKDIERRYSKQDFLDFVSNIVYGFDMDAQIGGIEGVSRNFDNWEKVFKNK